MAEATLLCIQIAAFQGHFIFISQGQQKRQMNKDSTAWCMLARPKAYMLLHMTVKKTYGWKAGGLRLSISAIRNENAEWP